MSRLPIFAAVLAAVLYLAPLFIDAPLTDPDEGLHASIAQEMYERGEGLVPRFIGRAFLDKPILFFWTQAASMAAFGMTTAAARLPGMLFALLCVATTGWLARVLFDARTGWIAAACYATMTLPFMLAQAPVHDMALVPLVNIALAALWRSGSGAQGSGLRAQGWGLRAGGSGFEWRELGVAGSALGLSILTKGLEGVAIVGVGYVAYLALMGGVTMRLAWRGVVVLGIAAAVAAPWYVAMAAREPSYLGYYFVARHFLAFTTDSQRHGGEPWWFYLPLVTFGGLPWILYVRPLTLRRRADRGAGSPELLVVTLLAGALALLSLSGSKASTYILPAMPAIAILAGRSWALGLAGEAVAVVDTRLRVGALAHAAVLFAVTALTPWAVGRYGDQPVSTGGALAFGVLSVVWLRTILGLRRCQAADAWPRLVMLTGATYALAFALFGSPLAQAHSSRDLATHLNATGRLPQTIYVMDGRVSFVYYLRPDLRRRMHTDQVQSVSAAQLAALASWPQDAVLTLPADLAQRIAGIPLLRDAPRRTAGRYLVVSP